MTVKYDYSKVLGTCGSLSSLGVKRSLFLKPRTSKISGRTNYIFTQCPVGK